MTGVNPVTSASGVIEGAPARIAPLRAGHAAGAARLHIAGQPGTFLTSLGADVLTVIYAALPTSRHGFGFAALGADAQASDVQGNDALLGFVSATTGVGGLFRELGARHAARLLPPLLARYARMPSLIGRSAQTVLYPLLAREPHGLGEVQPVNSAELLSIMVEPALRGHGLGAALLDALLAECAARRITQLDVTVDAGNAGARRFYAQHGFTQRRTFRLYGRDMCLYARSV